MNIVKEEIVNSEIVARLAKAVRSADIAHNEKGGSWLQYAGEFLLPELEKEGLTVLLVSDSPIEAFAEKAAEAASGA